MQMFVEIISVFCLTMSSCLGFALVWWVFVYNAGIVICNYIFENNRSLKSPHFVIYFGKNQFPWLIVFMARFHILSIFFAPNSNFRLSLNCIFLYFAYMLPPPPFYIWYGLSFTRSNLFNSAVNRKWGGSWVGHLIRPTEETIKN